VFDVNGDQRQPDWIDSGHRLLLATGIGNKWLCSDLHDQLNGWTELFEAVGEALVTGLGIQQQSRD